MTFRVTCHVINGLLPTQYAAVRTLFTLWVRTREQIAWQHATEQIGRIMYNIPNQTDPP